MSRAEIEAVLTTIPNLTNHGVGMFFAERGRSSREEANELAKERGALLANSREINICVAWLAGKAKRKSVNPRHSSYGLKHMVERDQGEYVSNGAFIVAAIHLGFPWRIENGSPNVLFGISERSLKEAV